MTSNGCTARPRTPTLVRLPALALAALLALAFLLAPAASASAAPSLAVTNITSTSATVTISGHTGGWWYTVSANSAPHISCTNDNISGASVDLTGLIPGANHTFTAWSTSTCSPTSLAWLASKDFTTQQAASPTLTAVVSRGIWGATLTLSNHSGDWYWKYTKPTSPAGACSSAVSTTSTSTGDTLAAGTIYTFKAYSDVDCSTLVATASDVTTVPGKVTGLTATGKHESISLSWKAATGATSYDVEWKSDGQQYDPARTASATSTSHTITGLSNGTAYTVRVIAKNNTGDGLGSPDELVVTPAAASLTESDVTHNSATLTIANYAGDWYYKANAAPHASCSSSAVSGTTKNLTNLSGNTNYTYKAYSDSGCKTELAAAPAFLTKPAKPAKPTAAAGAGSGKLTLSSSVAGGSGALARWQYTKDNGANWTDIDVTSTTLSYTVEGLTDGTDYAFKVRAVNATGTGPDSDTSDAAQPLDETLKVGGVTHNSATLALQNHSGDWWYKENSWTSLCIKVANGTATVTLTNLSPATSYTYTAYGSACSSNNKLTASTFLTRPGQVSGVSATGLHKALSVSWTAHTGTVTGYKVQWKLGNEQYNTGNRQKEVTPGGATTASITGLTNATEYTVRVTAYNTTGDGAASAESTATPTAATLTASGVTHDSATLTIANHPGDWYYKANAAPHASCSTNAVSGTTKDLTGLSGNTSYAYKAYGDSGCNTELAAAPTFLTKPGKPAKPTASPGAGSGKLTLASSVTGGGTISNWQYTKDNGANWTDIDVASTTLSYVVEGLTDGTNYAFKVRAKNATGTGPDSDASDAAAPADETLTASGVTHDSTTLTIGGHSGDWYYKANAAPHASCSTNAVSTSTVDLTGLSGNTSYAYKAYGDSGCNTELAAAPAFLTKPGKPAKPTVTAGAGSGKLTLASSVTGGGTIANWQYTKDNGANWTDIAVASTTLSYVVENLTDGTNYAFKVRAANATGTGPDSDASTAVAPRDETLTVSNVTKNGATLTIGNYDYTDGWHYKHASGTCSTEQSGATANVTNLAANTSYAFTAYSDSCATAVAAAPAFPTLPPKPAKPIAKADTGRGEITLTSSVTGDADLSRWEYKKKPENGGFDQDWTSVVTTSRTLSHVVSGLADGASYVFKVRAVNASGDGEESDESVAATTPAATSPDGTLTASSVAHDSATLTIANHSGDWYYKANAAPHDSCSPAQSGATADLTNLSGNTSYTYKAYSDSGCTVELFTAPAFLTRPGKPTTPTAAPGAGVGEITLASSVTGDADLSRWEYKKKEDNGSYDPDWTSVVTTSRTLSHVVSGLTGGTNYVFKVRAVNASGIGEESDESAAAAPVALPPPPATAPPAPPAPSATAGNATVGLTWTSGGDGGSAITKWQYVRKEGDKPFETIWTDVPDSGASTTTHTVTGLTNGVAYRFRVRAVNTIGAGAPSPESDVAVPAAPAASPTGWLARFGRAAGSQAVEMITGRMNAPAPGGSRMTLGGRSVDLNEDPERLLAKEGAGFTSPAYEGTGSLGLARRGTAGGPGGDESTGAYRETTVSELLRGGSFHLASAQEAEAVPGGRWSMWGRGARTSFEGASAVEGDVTTAMLGMDYEKGGVLMGVALSHSRGEGGFGKAGMEAALTSAHPYLRFALNERISAWGVLGMGRGEMTLEEKGRKIETDLEMRMGAFGVRGELAKAGGFDLAVKSDALLEQTDADAADGLAAVSAEATRLRVMLEASRAVAMKNGGRFTPSVEAGLRHDGGDADEGIGVEVGGGLRFTNPASGLTLELKARGLITHEGEDVADWGAGGMLRFAPGEAGRGLALTVRPSVGETAGGAERLWGLEDASRLAREEAGDINPRVRAEVGYGLDAWGGLLTPYAGLSVSEDGGGAYRLGGRFRIGESLSMSVEGGVREREDDDPVHGLSLRGSLRW